MSREPLCVIEPSPGPNKGSDGNGFQNVSHLESALPKVDFGRPAYAERQKKTLEQLIGRLVEIDREVYYSKGNADVVLELLRNVTKAFDEEASPGDRYRLSNVLLGLKCTGKTTLVKTLAQAVREQWPSAVVVETDGRSLRLGPQDVLDLLVEACAEKGFSISDSARKKGMPRVLAEVRQHKTCVLVVVDEAQGIYPLGSDTEETADPKRTAGIVLQLAHLSEAVGCVGWLTGSSQALSSLYSRGSHPDYRGRYESLNDKKYVALFWKGMRDLPSLREFFLVRTGVGKSDEELTDIYTRRGGAPGDLLKDNSISK